MMKNNCGPSHPALLADVGATLEAMRFGVIEKVALGDDESLCARRPTGEQRR